MMGIDFTPPSMSGTVFAPPAEIDKVLLEFPAVYLKFLVEGQLGESTGALANQRRRITELLEKGDDTGLKDHIVKVWSHVCKTMHVYRCIERFWFLKPNICEQPFFAASILPALASLHRQTPAPGSAHAYPTFLDIGSALGTDARKLLTLGVPPRNICCVDVVPGYWEAGLELWLDRDVIHPEGGEWLTFRVGNLLEDDDLALGERFDYVSAINVLHVLSGAEVRRFLERVREGFLAEGGWLFGQCVGVRVEDYPEGKEWWKAVSDPTGGTPRFLHSKASLKKLMESCGYVEVDVEHAPRREWMPSASSSHANTASDKENPMSKEEVREGVTRLTFSCRR